MKKEKEIELKLMARVTAEVMNRRKQGFDECEEEACIVYDSIESWVEARSKERGISPDEVRKELLSKDGEIISLVKEA